MFQTEVLWFWDVPLGGDAEVRGGEVMQPCREGKEDSVSLCVLQQLIG